VGRVANVGGSFRTLSRGLEPQGRVGRQADQGLARAKAPEAPPADQLNPKPFPRIPQGDNILSCPDLRTLSETTPQWRAEIQSLRANFETWGLQMRRREFIAGLGAAAWPLLVSAQQRTKLTIGYLALGTPGGNWSEAIGGIRRGLAEVGFSEGRDVTVEFHTVDGDLERVPALAADLVRRRPAAILVSSGTAALAAKAATRDIPIIFGVGDDPVELGLVASLNRPGGNLTGIVFRGIEFAEKRLELLRKAAPAAETIALLVGPADDVVNPVETRHVQSAARSLGLRLLVFNVTADTDITPVFVTLVEHQAGAVLIGASSILSQDAIRDQILSHAARFALPTMFEFSQNARAGGLLSYGPNLIESYRQIGVYTGRILKGEKPADLPVVRPAKFEFAINLKTAKALGLNLPPTLLAIADEVIE
jgi:putative tryptophan/tyrosine transport system substrate-binding protein